MFKIMSIPNQTRFWNAVEHSAGQIYLHLPDQTVIDLKRNHTARQLMNLMSPGKNGLILSLTESSDMPRMIRSIM